MLKFEDRDGVEPTQVGSGAFSGCTSLDYVVFPGFMLSAEPDSFSGCAFHWEDGSISEGYTVEMSGHKFTGDDSSSLEVYVPAAGGTFRAGDYSYRITESADAKEVVLIGFADGATVDKLYIPDSVKYLGFGWKVASVGAKAFMGDGSISSVFSTVDIGFKSFANCQGLEIAVMDGCGSVGAYSFANCRSIWFIGLETATQIGESAFSGCSGLTNADLSGVVSIGRHAFYGCALTLADLSSTTSIGYGPSPGTAWRGLSLGTACRASTPRPSSGTPSETPTATGSPCPPLLGRKDLRRLRQGPRPDLLRPSRRGRPRRANHGGGPSAVPPFFVARRFRPILLLPLPVPAAAAC